MLRETLFTPEDNDVQNLDTLYSSVGAVSKQLGCILIEHRYRNWATRITNNTIANMSPPMQHRDIAIGLKITLKKIIILHTLTKHMAHMT